MRSFSDAKLRNQLWVYGEFSQYDLERPLLGIAVNDRETGIFLKYPRFKKWTCR